MHFSNLPSSYGVEKENLNMNTMNWNPKANFKTEGMKESFTVFKSPQTDSDCSFDQKRMNCQNVKHSNVEIGFTINYTEFANLPVFDEKVDLIQVFEGIKISFDSPDWIANFTAIDNLRALNKSYPQEANSIFTAFGGYIMAAINSPKPCINKNILAFVYEVLTHAKTSLVEMAIVIKLADVLIKKLNTTNTLLKGLAESCMTALLDNCLCDTTIEAICSLAVDRHRNISKIAFHYIGSIVNILREGVSELQPDTLRIVFMTIAHNLESESANNKTLAKHMCQYFQFLMKENYENYVMFLYNSQHLTERYVQNLAKAVAQEHRKSSVAMQGKKSKVPLSSFKNDFIVEVQRAGF